MQVIRNVVAIKYSNDAFQRFIYSESYDEVANGKARVPGKVNFEGYAAGDSVAEPGAYDGPPWRGRISIAPDSVVNFSQERK
jgi:hypothetical protein